MYDDREIKDIYMCKPIEVDGELYPLQKWYNQLIDKKFIELEVSDITRMIRQKEFMDMAILKAIEYLKENPFIGEMYDGELLEKIFGINVDVLTNYTEEIKNILSNAIEKNNEYPWLEDEERIEFADKIKEFKNKIENL